MAICRPTRNRPQPSGFPPLPTVPSGLPPEFSQFLQALLDAFRELVDRLGLVADYLRRPLAPPQNLDIPPLPTDAAMYRITLTKAAPVEDSSGSLSFESIPLASGQTDQDNPYFAGFDPRVFHYTAAIPEGGVYVLAEPFFPWVDVYVPGAQMGIFGTVLVTETPITVVGRARPPFAGEVVYTIGRTP